MKDGTYSCQKKHINVSNDFFCAVSHKVEMDENTLIATCPPEASLNTVFICVGRLDLSVVKQWVRCLPITSVG